MAKRNIMRAFKINEISGVDVPAQDGARAVIMKRAPEGEPPRQRSQEPFEKDLADVLTSETDGHQHGVVVSKYDGKLSVWVTYAMGSDDETGHSHAIARDTDGTFKLAMVAGHTHTIDQAALTQAMLALTKGLDAMADDGTQGGDGADDKLQKQVDRLTKILGLNADERAHFDKLDDTEAQDAFLEKSADERQAEVKEVQKAAEDADPVVYTTDAGIELRKSAGELAISQAKELDTLRKRSATLEAEREQERLEKRAEEELPYLSGTVQARAVILKQIDAIEDEDLRKAAHESVKSQNEAMKLAFETKGVGGEAEPGSAEDKLEKLAKAHAAKHNVTFEKAYDEVLQSDEGQKIYAGIPTRSGGSED